MAKKATAALDPVSDPEPEFRDGAGIARLRDLIRHNPVGIPRLSDDDRTFLEQWRERLAASTRGASAEEIRRHIEGLLVHYPRPSMTEVMAERFGRDWCVDLCIVPPDLLGAACTAYRRSPRIYAPSPGVILAMVEPARSGRLYLAGQVDRLLQSVRMPHASG